jgi:hypothetical protein
VDFLQRLTYVKTPSGLADAGIACACILSVSGGSAVAVTPPDSTSIGGSSILKHGYERDLLHPLTLPVNRQVTELDAPAPGLVPLKATMPLNSLDALTGIKPPADEGQPAIKPSIPDRKVTKKPDRTSAVKPAHKSLAPSPESAIDPRYIVPPRVLDPRKIDEFSSQFVLNGNAFSHSSAAAITSGFESGNFQDRTFSFEGRQQLGSTTIQSVTADRIIRVNSEIEVAGVRSIVQDRTSVVTTVRPQTLLGFREQISLMGSCIDGTGRICTFLPGVKIDDSMINPRTLQPTGAKITSQFGDVISPASIAAIQQPGFQGGVDGENYGIDVYIPAVGIVSPPAGAPEPIVTGAQQGSSSIGVAVYNGRLKQSFATNGKESTLARTIRAANYITGDNNQLIDITLNGFGQILPDVQPINIAPGESGAKISVNPNLYRAANAIRIPDSSLTVYQGGAGYAASRSSNRQVEPAATHQALWVGLSPVVRRSIVRDGYYITKGEPIVVTTGGGEGGTLPVSVNLNDVSFDSGSLKNAYGQGYVTVFNRDVDRVDITTTTQRTDYYPHISFTGTKLTESSLWRYFGGAIFNLGFQSAQTTQDIKAYIGTDYSSRSPGGLSFNIGGVGYVNPDPEHYSQLFTSLSQSIGIGDRGRNRLVFAVNGNYVADGSIVVNSSQINSSLSSIDTSITANIGNISFSGKQFFGGLLPNSVENKTVFNIGWQVNDRLNLGTFVNLFDQNAFTNPVGASLSLGLDPNSNSVLALSWNTASIDFRRSLGSTANIFQDRSLNISLRHGF